MSETLSEVLAELASTWNEDPDAAADELTDALSDATMVANLSQQDALEFMRMVHSQAGLWIDALKGDLGILN